jgi:DNA-3-methyladenine glycosylase
MPRDPERLGRAALPADTRELAEFLIGKALVHDSPDGRTSGRIVETEAYLVGDAAGHAFRGMTPRNRSLFLERGHAYVYRGYGIWNLVNVSSETPGVGAGVLLRALEPIDGIAIMRGRRNGAEPFELARGPGLLSVAMNIDLGLDGVDLCADGPLWLGLWDRPAGEIGVSLRIGITRNADRLLRFYERGNPAVSGPRRLRG